jgi:hypothetical protein
MGLSEIPLYREKLFEQAGSALLAPIPGVRRGEVLGCVFGGQAIVKAIFREMFIVGDDIYL